MSDEIASIDWDAAERAVPVVRRQNELIAEQQDEIDALRAHIAGANSRRDQRTAALFCLAGVLAAASAGPPVLLLLALVAAGAGIVSWVGRK